MKKEFIYKGEKVYLNLEKYHEPSNTALIFKAEDGEIYFVATVNIDAELPNGFVLIKNYGENEGILEWLVENNIVIDTGNVIPLGYTYGNICILSKEYL